MGFSLRQAARGDFSRFTQNHHEPPKIPLNPPLQKGDLKGISQGFEILSRKVYPYQRIRGFYLAAYLPRGVLSVLPYQCHPASPYTISMALHNKHGIAIAVKPILAGYGLPVSLQDEIAASKGGHQHQERGFWQVKIGDQSIHHTQGESGVDE